jgi:hypothetical protein
MTYDYDKNTVPRRHDPIIADPRFDELRRALRAVDIEIERYEDIVNSSPERRLDLGEELVKLRFDRSEILDQLREMRRAAAFYRSFV